jgi:hypothetical protein
MTDWLALARQKTTEIRSAKNDKTHPSTLREGVSSVLALPSLGKIAPGEAADDWTDANDERAAIVEYDGGAPRSWAEAFARLDGARPPADVPQRRWLRFIDDCGAFLDGDWPAYAAALGWGAAELFGCDRHRPFARIDRQGLLWIVDGRRIVALTADTAVIETFDGARLTYRRAPSDPGQVLVWQLNASEEKNSGC